MEAFSLLKYWQSSGGGAPTSADGHDAPVTTTIVTVVRSDDVESDDECNDDGPVFDLDFFVPNNDDKAEDKYEEELGHVSDDNASTSAENVEEKSDGDGESDSGRTGGEGEFNCTLSSGSSNDRSDQNLSLSSSDDLSFKARMVVRRGVGAAEEDAGERGPATMVEGERGWRIEGE